MTDTHIKIKPVVPRIQYTGNGVTTSFPYTFAIFDDSDMVVYVDDEVVETGYTITGAGETDGGNVVFDTAPDDGAKITLLRDVPIERLTDFQEGGTFRPKNLNDEFDRQTAFIQQVQEKVDRTLILPPTSDIDPSQILGEVERIYSSIDNVDAVADDLTKVNSVFSDLTNIDKVANNINKVNTVGNNISNVNTVSGISSNVTAVAGNASNINTCAANIAEIVDAPNQASNAAASAELSAQYANDKINQTHISNCITKIPQNIKIKLSSGTITLEAGSKIYVPNGSGIFYEYLTTVDKTYSYSYGASTRLLFYNRTTGILSSGEINNCLSGPDSPSGSGTIYWYDTTNNIVKRSDDGGSTWIDNLYSFPIAIIKVESSSITSVENVFNGFGYIGSSIFALPNVKGLIPNGRNSDGTLKSTEFSINSVKIKTYTDSRKSIIVYKPGIGISAYNDTTYDVKNNIVINSLGENQLACHCGSVVYSSGTITSFTTKTAFQAIDYSNLPPSSEKDDSTNLATTEWVHRYIETSGAFSTWTKASKGGFKLANGLIVNWGRNGSTNAITFSVPFTSNTSYSVSTAVDGTEQGGTSWGQVNSLTSTGLTLVGPSNSKTIYWLAIGY